MNKDDLAKYCTRINEDGFTNSKQIDLNTVITAPWVRMKCQFGYPMYDSSYCCPPQRTTFGINIINPEYNRHWTCN